MPKETDSDTSQLYAKVPTKLKEEFDAACKAKGIKKKHVLTRLATMWIKGEIKID